jgi:N-acetylmuramate 1-kinase
MASNDARAQSRRQFLKAEGWGDAELVPFAADASFRRYFRLRGVRRTALLMDAPPPKERTEPFTNIALHLRRLGLSAPEVLAADHAHGWLLLEDFGDQTFTKLLARGHDEMQLYELACDALLELQQHPAVNTLALPAYDTQALLGEAALFVEWFVPATSQSSEKPSKDAYLQAWTDVLAALPALEPTLVLRDYHVDNLMLVAGRAGNAACGLLDFQDALRGCPAYDLASLLEDARRDVSADVVNAMQARYLAAQASVDAGQLQCAYTILAAQRHAKVAGIFVRLWQRDGKPHYLRHLPRVLHYLQGHLAKPELAPVQQWVAEHIDFEFAGAAAQALASD